MKYYKELLTLIKEYKKTKVWEIISGDDIFKIQGYKKPIFVALLGQAKICNEINIYLGKEELYEQYDIIYGDYYKHPDMYYRISCYKLVVEDAKELLTPTNREILKKNHIKMDMAIMRFEKGKVPRLVTEKEAEFLLPIMKDLLKIANYIKEKNLRFPKEVKIDEQYVFSIKDEVKHRIAKFETGHQIQVKQSKINEEILNKVLIFSKRGTFGVGFFYGPFYNSEELNYNRLLILNDLETGKILDIQSIVQREEEDLINYLLKSFLKIKRYPNRIAFSSTDTFLRCQDLIAELQMEYKIDIENELLFDQWLEIREYMERQK